MSKFVIKKRVSLEFLGDEYKESYLVLRGIPLSEFQEILDETEKIEDQPKKAVPFMLGVITERFIEGKFPNDAGELEAITKDDLSSFADADVVITVFQRLSGQANPKSEGQSSNT